VSNLGVDIQYDSAASGWLARPTWRDGNAMTPATLVFEPHADSIPLGTYTARVAVTSPGQQPATTSIVATLVVTKGNKVSSANKCGASQARLAHIRTLTDPVTGTSADAQQVLSLVPSLVRDLCLPGEQVEAQLRLAEAHMTLSQASRACEVLRGIEKRSASTPFAENVRVYLSRCQ
jgi:hypothetical protein